MHWGLGVSSGCVNEDSFTRSFPCVYVCVLNGIIERKSQEKEARKKRAFSFCENTDHASKQASHQPRRRDAFICVHGRRGTPGRIISIGGACMHACMQCARHQLEIEAAGGYHTTPCMHGARCQHQHPVIIYHLHEARHTAACIFVDPILID